MLWTLWWDIDNWQSRFHTFGMYSHALSVVMRRWQLTEHDWYIRDLLPCSDRCHKTMATDGACFIHEWYISMLWPLSWDDGNWQSMTHTWGGVIILLPLSWHEDNLWGMIHIFGMYNHALSVVMRQRQLAGHVFKDIWYITMLSPLSWDDDNWRSMFRTLEMNTVLWPLSWDDGNWQSMTHSWEGIIILWPLSCDDDNWRSMFHTWMIYYPALTVVMRWRQLTKNFSYHMDIDYINRKKKVLQVHSREHVHFHMEALLLHLSV